MTSAPERVLVVDDEASIRRYLRTALASHHYAVSEAATGEEALVLAVTQLPNLIILDLGLPDLDGVQVTRRLREWSQVPVLILSVRGNEADKIAALDAGADDFMTKPFGIGELLARMRAVSRRLTNATAGPNYSAGGLALDLSQRMVTLDNQRLRLTPIEYDLLRVFVTHAGRVLTHRQLIQLVWGAEQPIDAHLLRVNISNLRHKIETDPARPRRILTEPGVGYRLVMDDEGQT